MGVAEIRRRIGMSRQRVQQLAEEPGFPEPYDHLLMGRVWRTEDVEAWIRRYRPDLADRNMPHGRINDSYPDR